MAVGVQQQQRRDTEANWITSGKVLAQGEIGYATDSHIIKMGDGVNTWDELTIPYDGRYLPIGGKAADSEMLDGISAGGFVLVGDASTAPTADKIALRDGSGRMKAVAGVANDDVVNFGQLSSSVVSRTVSATATLALTDAGKMIVIDNAAYTPTIVVNIPTNATVAFPIGSFVDLFTSNKGPATITPAGGVSLWGQTLLYGGASSTRLVKTSTDGWIVKSMVQSPGPLVRRKIKTGADNTMASGVFLRLRLDGPDDGSMPFSNNADTLGSNEQYNSATDLYRAYCRRSGWYDVIAQISTTEAVNGRLFIQLRINNTEYKLGAGNASGAAENSVNYATNLPLNVNDYVEVWTYQDGAGSKTPTDSPYASSSFEWMWERPL